MLKRWTSASFEITSSTVFVNIVRSRQNGGLQIFELQNNNLKCSNGITLCDSYAKIFSYLQA